jgi:2',3'-cyclic-nucleotide 2'-phosphodiesterase (5'-nucleotidase family)
MRLRILATNDFLGSLAPHPTSYGRLPGGHALQQTVARLREGQPTIWADAGDFSQGGPLSTASGGVHNFTAAGQLGIDVATVGNHEFDWGLAHLAEHRHYLPFPLICANLDIGLAPTALLDTPAGPVGFVGLTHPQLSAFTPFTPPPPPSSAGGAPAHSADTTPIVPERADLAKLVPEHAERLRAQGAVAVVVLIHFGVNWSVAPDGSHQPDPTPVLDLCSPFQHAVDAIVLGHTLGRWAGVIDGVPYAQPWAFGAELGVIDLDLQSGNHSVELATVDGEPRRWEGAGHSAIDQARETVVGHLNTPLRIDFANDISLAHFAAAALRAASHADGAVVPVVGMHQPAIEGVMYEWPAGAVSEADLSRFWPWTEDRSLLAEVSAAELETILTFTAPEPWLAWGTSIAPDLVGATTAADATSTTAGPSASRTLAVPRDYVDWATVQIAQLLGRELSWQALEVRLRDALRTALRG